MTYSIITRLLRLARQHVFDEGRKGIQAERMIPRLKERLFASQEHRNHLSNQAHERSQRMLRMYA